MAVVVVESPAKAKTINKYLGPSYTVLASYGHVRDLPAKDGSVDTESDFAMTWEVATDSKKHLRAIAEAMKSDDELILATDPDREGEAISWHLTEALAKSIKKTTKVSRVTFNAITKTAVTEAMKAPRQVDMELVEAYLARRALDYLVGFNLSPVLWRKLPGAKSAGRVQSVCLRLIVDREMEIEAFRSREYWTVTAALSTPGGQPYEARLTVLGAKKLDKFDIASAAAAEVAVQAVHSRSFSVKSVEARPASRNPYAPFMTSTLQQEASRKFGMGARAAMNAAQRLYEAGHITYMRTDGIDMAPEAVMAARAEISRRFGPNYVPDSPRMYKNKAKNAQEAHECIRPTEMAASPDTLRLTEADQRKIYDLIWKRTIASQMAAARMERTTVDIASPDGQVELRATGQVVLFDGFMAVYVEGRDDVDHLRASGGDADEDGSRLPLITQGEPATKGKITPTQSFTQPPPRYTEATLVKRMEELGIGRPSTYASIVTTIQDREYVRKEQNRLIAEDKGRLVTAFLANYFAQYVEYDFTADLEEQLDDISSGTRNYKEVLSRFWRDFSAAIAQTADLRIGEVLEKINDILAPHLYPPREDGSNPRICAVCGTGNLNLKTARSGGAFIGCSNYPDCRYTRPLSAPDGDEAAAAIDGKVLGLTDAGAPVTLRSGRFGPYVQIGEATEAEPKPPRASLPKGWDAATLDLGQALRLLALPRPIGAHPTDGELVEAGLGRYGPFVKHGKVYANLADVEEVFSIGMNRAVEVLANKYSKGRTAAAAPLAELGEHPEGGALQVMEGRYGPYVKWGKVFATLPKGVAPETVTLEMAIELASEKAAKGGKAKTRAPAKPKGAAKSGAAKSGAAKSGAAAKAGPRPAVGPEAAAPRKTAAKPKAAALKAKPAARNKATAVDETP